MVTTSNFGHIVVGRELTPMELRVTRGTNGNVGAAGSSSQNDLSRLVREIAAAVAMRRAGAIAAALSGSASRRPRPSAARHGSARGWRSVRTGRPARSTAPEDPVVGARSQRQPADLRHRGSRHGRRPGVARHRRRRAVLRRRPPPVRDRRRHARTARRAAGTQAPSCDTTRSAGSRCWSTCWARRSTGARAHRRESHCPRTSS